MNKIHIALLLAAAILVSGCAGQGGQQQTNVSANATGGSGSSGTSAPSGGSGTSGSVQEDVNVCVTNCATIGSLAEACRIGCYLDDAKAAKDPARCDPIKGIENATLFYSACLGDVAGEQGSVAACDRAPNASVKDWCIVTAADKIKDPSICAGVNDSIMKSVCLDDTNKSK